MFNRARYWIIATLCVLALAGFSGLMYARDMPKVPVAIFGILIFLFVLALCLRDARLGALLLLFSLPFERIPSLQVGGATLRISQVVLAALVLSLVVNGLMKKRSTISVSPYIIMYLLFVASIINSFWQMQALSRGVTVFIFIMFTSLAMWVVPAALTSKSAIVSAVRALFWVTIVICLFGFYQYVGDVIGLPNYLTGLRELYTKVVFGIPRVQSTALEPLYLANFLLIPLSLAITLAIRRTEYFSWRLLAGVMALGGLTLILTLSRGGYVGFAASIAVIILSSLIKLIQPKVMFALMGLVAILVVAVFGVVNFSNVGQKSIDEVERHFVNINQDASTLHRLGSFDSALEAFDSAPFTGVGIGNFGPWLAHYPTEIPVHGWAIVNNAPLEILAETGIFGLFSAIAFLLILFALSYKAVFAAKDPVLKAIMLGLIAACVGVLAQYQFFSTFYIMHVWALFGLMIATQSVIFNQENNDAKQ